MIMIRYFLLAGLICSAADAQTVVASQTIRSRSVITPQDVVLLDKTLLGGFADVQDVIGMEARNNLFSGRLIRRQDVGPPAIVDRNQIVTLIYIAGALTISAEGRALSRAGIGDRIRVMNLTSRTTVFGVVLQSGNVEVSP